MKILKPWEKGKKTGSHYRTNLDGDLYAYIEGPAEQFDIFGEVYIDLPEAEKYTALYFNDARTKKFSGSSRQEVIDAIDQYLIEIGFRLLSQDEFEKLQILK